MIISKLTGAMTALCIAAPLLAGGAINAKCPISGNAVDSEAPTATYKEQTIGFCCAGCVGEFEAWADREKDAFLVEAISSQMKKDAKDSKKKMANAADAGDPYTLGTCPVSGRPIATGDDMVARQYDGREIRFCCPGCVETFEDDKQTFMSKVDKKMVADQKPFYPMESCVVSGEPLTMDGEDVATNVVYNNRLLRLCCKRCMRMFDNDPAGYVAKLDKAVMNAQRDDYPMNTCIIAGGKLGSMGEPYEIVVANRLVRFCCEGCVDKFMANPAKRIAAIDAAWKKSGAMKSLSSAEPKGRSMKRAMPN